MDTAREALAKVDELCREVKAEAGPDMVKQLKVGDRARNPDKREALIHSNNLIAQVMGWTGNAPRNRKTELEDPLEGGIQTSGVGLWGDSEPNAESGDGDPEAGEGEEGKDLQVQPTNSFTFLD